MVLRSKSLGIKITCNDTLQINYPYSLLSCSRVEWKHVQEDAYREHADIENLLGKEFKLKTAKLGALNKILTFCTDVVLLHLGHVPTTNVSWMFRRDGARDSE